MSYPIKYPTPQGANIQIFNVGGSTITNWVKPQGASFVWFTLIGAGGIGGNGASGAFGGGGGSGAVTNFMCPAFLIPDDLQVLVGRTNVDATKIIYQQKDGTGYELLRANYGSSGGLNFAGSGAGAMAPNYFTAMGFFQSIAGQSGSSGTSTPSTTTFLSGGCASTDVSFANYGYGTGSSNKGFFMMQPIIVGLANGGSAGAQSAIGCGGSGGDSAGTLSRGGDGMVVIITW